MDFFAAQGVFQRLAIHPGHHQHGTVKPVLSDRGNQAGFVEAELIDEGRWGLHQAVAHAEEIPVIFAQHGSEDLVPSSGLTCVNGQSDDKRIQITRSKCLYSANDVREIFDFNDCDEPTRNAPFPDGVQQPQTSTFPTGESPE